MVPVWAHLLLILLLAPAQSQSIQKTFQKQQQQTSSLQSGYRQTVRLKGVRDASVSSGKFYYISPDSILIKFDDPKGEYLMIRGKDLFLKKNGKQEVRRKINPDEPETGLSMLLDLFRTGGKQFQDEFQLQMSYEKNDLIVTLTQKKSDEDVLPSRIENRLSRDGLNIKSVLVEFDGGHSILYEFTKPVRNRSIPPSVFEHPERS